MRSKQEDLILSVWHKCHGSPKLVSQATGISERRVYRVREILAKKYNIILKTSPYFGVEGSWMHAHAYNPRVNKTIKGGALAVFNDAHYWPGRISLAHTALLIVLRMVKPLGVCANGDIFDGATISRHEPMGWQKLPTVIEELDTCKMRLGEIEQASPDSWKSFTIGNHDSRFDRRLATEISEFEDVPGMSLEHHIGERWPMSYSLMVNEDIDPVFVLHNIKGGMHAPFNNVKAAGCTVVTGHLHSQKTMPFTNLFRTFEGIDSGCLADVDDPAFAYGMDRPADHRSGFVIIEFDENGFALPADLCRIQYLKHVHRAIFRGKIICERDPKTPR